MSPRKSPKPGWPQKMAKGIFSGYLESSPWRGKAPWPSWEEAEKVEASLTKTTIMKETCKKKKSQANITMHSYQDGVWLLIDLDRWCLLIAWLLTKQAGWCPTRGRQISAQDWSLLTTDPFFSGLVKIISFFTSVTSLFYFKPVLVTVIIIIEFQLLS